VSSAKDLPVTIDDVRAAARTIEGRLRATPLVASASLGARVGTPLHLKLECWQKTGSFKTRGVLNRVAQLAAAERARGLVGASAGNHAQALAWAAATVGAPCTVVMPHSAPAAKLDATRGYGAEVILESSTLTVIARAQALAAERGLTFVHPFDEPAVIAGQGTVGLELARQLPDVGTVVVPVGGGGLIAGVAVALRALLPADVRLVGVEPDGAASMWRSRREGAPARLDAVHTIADGLAAPFAGELTFPIVERCVDDLVLVSDDEIRAAMTLLLERVKVLAEPAGAAALAALLAGRAAPLLGRPVVAVVSGGNVDVARLAALLA
jgi:threonine dehydratase